METASDVLVATMLGFSLKAKNVGAVTSVDESKGKTLISSEGKVTDERIFDDGKQYYLHEHRPTAKTGSEWNLKDELKREYLTSGNQTVTFTPSGWQTNAQKLDTAGNYVWRQETVDPSGPYAGAPVRHWGTSNYNSNGFVTRTSLPSGSMSATFDEDGKVVSASGSVSHVNLFSGRAFSHLGGTGHGAKGGEGAAVLVAKREVSRDRLGEFQGSVTHTISPVVNTNSTTGETALAFNEPPPVIKGSKYGYQNEMDKRTVYQIFHGTVTADNNSFLVTDSGDVPQGESSSTNMLLPETDFGVDSSYGNPIADLAPWDGFDVPFTNSATWTGSSGGSGGPQPGDSPLTLGTGNHVDLGMFSSAYDYKGETVGASFAWQITNAGTPPSDPNSPLGDAVFNSGNFQSPQEPGDDLVSMGASFLNGIRAGFSVIFQSKGPSEYFDGIREGFFVDGLAGDAQTAAYIGQLLYRLNTPIERTELISDATHSALEMKRILESPEFKAFVVDLTAVTMWFRNPATQLTEAQRQLRNDLSVIANNLRAAIGEKITERELGRIVGLVLYEVAISAAIAGVSAATGVGAGAGGSSYHTSFLVLNF